MKTDKKFIRKTVDRVLDEHEGCCLGSRTDRNTVAFALKKELIHEGGPMPEPEKYTFKTTVTVENEEEFRRHMDSAVLGHEAWLSHIVDLLLESTTLIVSEGLDYEITQEEE